MFIKPKWYRQLRKDIRPEPPVVGQLEQLRKEWNIPHDAFALRIMSSPATTIKLQRHLYNQLKQAYPDQDENFILTQVLASRVMPPDPEGFGWSEAQVLQAMENINTFDDLCRLVVSLDLQEPATPDPWGIGEIIDEILGWKLEDESSPGSGSPSRDQWGAISTLIARGLESAREKWFTLCVHILRDIRDTDEDYSEVEIVNSELGGKANLAITAYQLWFVSNMLAAKQYISRDEGQDFADILYLQAGSTQIDDILAFWEKYNEVSDDGGEQLRRFSNDVAAYITSNETPLTEGMLIALLTAPGRR